MKNNLVQLIGGEVFDPLKFANILFCVWSFPIKHIIYFIHNQSVCHMHNQSWPNLEQMMKTVTTDTSRRTKTRTKIDGDKRTRRPSRSDGTPSRSDEKRTLTYRCYITGFFFFLFNAFSRFKPTSERLRWPPVHRADLPAAVWVCSGSAEDQQGHGAAEKWDEKILPDSPVDTPTTEGWRNSFLLSSPQPLTTSTFSTKKRRSRRRRFQCYGRKWWRWRSWKRELIGPLIVSHHHIVASLAFVLHGGRFKMLIWDWNKLTVRLKSQNLILWERFYSSTVTLNVLLLTFTES